MGELNAWIKATREEAYGTLQLKRAVALAEAAVREGLDHVSIITDQKGADLIAGHLPKKVDVVIWNEVLTPPQEAAKLVELLKPFVPKRVDAGTPRPLLYLVGNKYESGYQKMLWKAGVEVVVVCDEGPETYSDWYVLGKPYGADYGVISGNGYTRFLRGAQYAPLRFEAVRAILKQHTHKTAASDFTVATENLDAKVWLPLIAKAINGITPPEHVTAWNPTLTILPGPDCASDDELKALANGNGLKVSVAKDRFSHVDKLMKCDVLFAADGMTLHEAIALGVVRVALPRAGAVHDPMLEHLVAREASPKVPAPEATDALEQLITILDRVCFQPSYRRGQNRIGQYLCDGLGAVRVIRQTARKVYEVPQNLVRFFESADPLIEKL